MLPEVLKFIRESDEKVIHVDTLLDRIGTEPTAPENASSHLAQALADGRRLGLVSIQRDRIKPLVPLDGQSEPLNFASQLLLLTTQAPKLDDLPDDGGSRVEEASEGRLLRPRKPDMRQPPPKTPLAGGQSRGGYVRSKLDPEPKADGRRMRVSGIMQAAGSKRTVGRSRSGARKRSRSRRGRSASRARSRGGRRRGQSSRSRSRSRR
ncbi:uncharacterized protein LOC115270463 [Aedes albopictus]|uniref:Uncharacterized protein n=1 Tax=Aedes albopictus TaxID=7160 RepID=A0ABM1XJG6_AEDAL|nr:uncharacterized protein LOC115270463 [Aedes albopictus]